MKEMVDGVKSDDVKRQLVATTLFRKLLSKERNPPIERVIHCGVIPYLVRFLRSQNHVLQVHSLSAVVNFSLKLHGH
jgi:importin subunit alpha-6/7